MINRARKSITSPLYVVVFLIYISSGFSDTLDSVITKYDGFYSESDEISQVQSSNCEQSFHPAAITFQYQQGWPQLFSDFIWDAIGLTNLDNNNDQEIIVSPLHSKTIHILDCYGDDLSGWPVEYSGFNCSAAVAGDVDFDDKTEIFQIQNLDNGESVILCFESDGQIRNGWPVSLGKNTRIVTSPVLSDVDADGNLEVIVSLFRGDSTFVFNADGSLLKGWPQFCDTEVRDSPVIGDLDSDGDLEIIVISEYHIHAWHHNGDNVDRFPVRIQGDYYTEGIAMGDLDNNGDQEIVINTVGVSLNVQVYHHTGVLFNGWPKTTHSSLYAEPCLGDLDDDGDLEIILGTTGLGTAYHVYAWHHSGELVEGWPAETEYGEWCQGSAAIGDIDADGDMEVIIGSDNHKLYAFHHDAELVDGFPLSGPNGQLSSPVSLGDVDNDKDVEIAVGSLDKNVYVWDFDSPYYLPGIEWGSYHHDSWHTGWHHPKRPQKVCLSVEDDDVVIRWSRNHEPDLISYNVYRRCDRNEPYKKIGTNIQDTLFVDKQYTAYYNYSYVVSAIVQSGFESRYSNELNINTLQESLEDFEDGNAEDWIPLNGHWQVTADSGDFAYCLEAHKSEINQYSIFQKYDYNDFDLFVDARSAADFNVNDAATVVVLFNYRDMNNCYCLRLSHYNMFNTLFKISEGSTSILGEYKGQTFNDNAYHRIHVHKAGSAISIYFDDLMIMAVKDTELSLGKIGMGSYQSSAFFDNIYLHSISDIQKITQEIILASDRLNMISLHCLPENLEIANVTANMNSLWLVKDDSEGFYIPEYDVNTIQHIDYSKGYQVFLYGDQTDTLQIEGYPLHPEEISFRFSTDKLHMIGCPYQYQYNITDVFQAIQPFILTINDDAGHYWIPSYDVNTIGAMVPGKGYQIYLNSSVEFIWPKTSDLTMLMQVMDKKDNLNNTQHYKFQETGCPFGILILDSELTFESDDEIGVFDGDHCVGASFVNQFPLLLTAWEHDKETGLGGFHSGNSISLRLYNGSDKTESELNLVFEDGCNNEFGSAPFTVCKIVNYNLKDQDPVVFNVAQNYPNPFNRITTIPFEIPHLCSVEINIYNIKGQHIQLLLSDQMKAGMYEVKWDGCNESGISVGSGIFFIQVKAGSKIATQKLLLVQ